MKVITKLLLFSIVSIALGSCVSTKKYQEMQSKRASAEKENAALKDQNRKLQTQNNEYSSDIARYESQVKSLKEDTTKLGGLLRNLVSSHQLLSKDYNDLLAQHQQAVSGSQAEAKRILSQLQKSQGELIKREDSLTALERAYQKRKLELDLLSSELAALQANLKQKEEAYDRLHNEVARKDSMMNALKNSLTKALIGFENQGLTVSTRNGRVYVSMDNKLMFPSGSFDVNPKGKEALKQLGSVLQDNSDINILVEGHTDNVPYAANGKLDDNWDLSAKRATSITRILLQTSKIDPSKITAAGRGEFSPIESNESAEGRAKNRRTEVILMPDLNKLYNIVTE